MSKVLVLSSVLLLVICVNSQTATPNIRVFLTNRGLNYANIKAITDFTDEIVHMKFNDISGKRLGTYFAKNFKFTSFRHPNVYTHMVPEEGIFVKLHDGAFGMEAEWGYRNIITNKKGPMSVTAAKISTYIGIGTFFNYKGTPEVKVTFCRVRIGKFDVRLRRGGLGKMLFKWHFERKLKSKMEAFQCDVIKRIFTAKANNLLSSLELMEKFSDDLSVDYSFSSAPEFYLGHLETSHKGITVGDDVTNEHSKVHWLRLPRNSMMAFSISKGLFESALRVMSAKGLLKENVELKKLGLLLDVADFIQDDLQKQSAQYQFSKSFLKLEVTSLPEISIDPEFFNVTVAAKAFLIVNVPGHGDITLAYWALSAKATVGLVVENNRLVAQVVSMTLGTVVEIERSEELSVDFIQVISDSVISYCIPRINSRLQGGFPLPQAKNIEYYNAKVRLEEGWMAIESDFKAV